MILLELEYSERLILLEFFKMSLKIVFQCAFGFILLSHGIADINYCVLEQCVCSIDTIICSGLISQTNGRFLTSEKDAIRQIRLYNSYLTFLDFMFDFPKLGLLGLRDCIVSCPKLQEIVANLPNLTLEVSTTCPGM